MGRRGSKYLVGIFVLGTVVLMQDKSTVEVIKSMYSFEQSDYITQDNKPLIDLDDEHQVRMELLRKGIQPIVPGPDLEYYEKTYGNGKNVTIVSSDNSLSAWKHELYSRLDRIRLMCGDLCRLNSIEAIADHTVPNEGNVFPTVVVPEVDCKAILSNEDIDAGDMTFPPLVPEELEEFYTLSGAYHIRQGKDKVRKDAYLNGEAEKSLWPTGNVWKEDDINDAVAKVGSKKLVGPYGLEETIYLTDSLSQVDIKGKSVLVIGSSHPWVEAIALYLGAKNVTTLEYGEIISTHPQIKTETPSSIRKKYLANELEHFDGIISHSSLEHSGLGRYGDALNPWGDILAVTRAWCVTKPKGFMWAGVPTGRDFVFYNWHRVYGKVRWPLLAINWRQVGTEKDFDAEEAFDRGPWKSMHNLGFIFEKIDTSEYADDIAAQKVQA